MIAVLEAAKAGKQIQWRSGYSFQAELTWQNARLDMLLPSSWNFTACEYRVKPEPREWDIAVHKRNNRPYPPDWLSHDSTNSWEIVHVQEVPK
jgi:hypothetical protein